MSNRRQFLAASAASLVAASMPRLLLAERNVSDPFANAYLGAYQQGLLTISTFQGLVGGEFRMFLEDGTVTNLRLTQVIDHNVVQNASASSSQVRGTAVVLQGSARTTQNALTKPPVQLAQFSAVFSHSASSFTQDTYVLDHARLGRFSAFVVPNSNQTCTVTFCNLVARFAVVSPVHGSGLLSM